MNCRVCSGELYEFMDFGQMPRVNGLVTLDQFEGEFFGRLAIGRCSQCLMVQVLNTVPPEETFGAYPYMTASSTGRIAQYTGLADKIKDHILPKEGFLVEIGCNDGSFLRNFKAYDYVGVDPAGSHNDPWILPEFFTMDVARIIDEAYGRADVICGFNTFCHIPDINTFFTAIRYLLKPEGTIIFQDPYWPAIFNNVAFDQIQDERIFYFSIKAIQNLARQHDLYLVNAEAVDIDGGAMRYYLRGIDAPLPSLATHTWALQELDGGYFSEKGLNEFAHKTKTNKWALVRLLEKLTGSNKRVVGYACTSKSTTLLNYAGIGQEYLEYILDTTPGKQGKYSPGMHIPIVSPDQFYEDYPDYALMLAWNHEAEILDKEQEFMASGGRFIYYVPDVGVGTANPANLPPEIISK
jgi:methylation protein EvaC